MYIELHTASAFSFLRGASLPETLAERAAALEYPAMALVDRDGLYGMPRFHKAAQAAGVRAIVGVELTMADGQATNDDDLESAKFSTRPSSFVLRHWSLPVLVSSRG